MRWRVLLWAALAVGAAAAVGLGVDIVVAGPSEASGLAEIIAGFCELVAAVLAVAGLVGKRRTAAIRQAIRDGAVPEPGACAGASRSTTGTSRATGVDGGKYVVDARDAIGVQIGDGTIQHIDARRTPPQQRQGGAS